MEARLKWIAVNLSYSVYKYLVRPVCDITWLKMAALQNYKINVSKKLFHEYHQSVKQFVSRSHKTPGLIWVQTFRKGYQQTVLQVKKSNNQLHLNGNLHGPGKQAPR